MVILNNNMPFVNKNKSFTFNMEIDTTLRKLSGFTASEVLISNKSGRDLFIYDNDNFADDRRFLIKTSESMVLRGITNTNEVSAKVDSLPLSGNVYFRSAYFSNFNQF
jgi:hypothetical protein